MKSSAVVGGLFNLDGINPETQVTATHCSSNLHAGPLQSDGRLPILEIDIEFEDLEQKTAPQSDTSYLDRMVHFF